MYIVDFYQIRAVKAVLTFQENDGSVRGEVGVRLGDVVGEVVALQLKVLRSLTVDRFISESFILLIFRKYFF